MLRVGRAAAREAGSGRIDVPAVVLLGVLLRLGLVLCSRGGIRGSFGYDASVYYAAADALLHGRLPYRDFLLLHPPGLMLALTPFALLGTWCGDHVGFMVANATFAVVGATCAGLVVRIARRLELPRRAALAGGAFYAFWFGAVQAETEARLEPLGSLLFLLGLHAFVGRRPLGRNRLVLAGMALGGAVSIKIWWSAPVAVLLVWAVRRRQAVPLLSGLAVTALVVDLPFFAAAPRDLVREVVLDQLGRHDSGYAGLARVQELASIRQAFGTSSAAVAVLLVALVVATAAVAAAWRSGVGRLPVALALTQLLVLAAAPTYFSFYAGYVAGSLALVVAAATASAPRWGRTAGAGLLAGAVALTAVTVSHRPAVTGPVPGAAVVARGVAHTPCLVSDTPMALIELDALSRGLSHRHCPNWVDVSGHTYDVDAPRGSARGRLHNPRWQADLLRYLTSGDAVILFRHATGADAATVRAVRRHPVLVRSGRFTVYATR